MGSTHDLSHLDNHTLLRQLTRLIADDRQQEAKILAHIAEVDARRLYADAAYSSMFAYCTDALNLSEAAAFRRITAARAARRFPVLLQKVASGELHLCAIKLLAPHLTAGNCAQLVALATHASKRELERRLAELFPKPLVADSLRKLSSRTQPKTGQVSAAPDGSSTPCTNPQRVNAEAPIAGPTLADHAGAIRAQPRDSLVPLTSEHYKVQFTADEELRRKIDRARELLPMGCADLAGLFGRALDVLIDDLERKRFGSKGRVSATRERAERVPGPALTHDAPKSRRSSRAAPKATTHPPSRTEPEPQTKPRSRAIPRAMRREVDRRDGGQCTFTRADGKRCSERRALELHHLQPFARGGPTQVENLTLRCRTHNLYAAELDFGRRAIERFRCREPGVGYRADLPRRRDTHGSDMRASDTHAAVASSAALR